MTEPTALQALKELAEEVNPRPWRSVSEEAGDVGTGLVYGAPPEEVTLGNFERDENAAYAALAVNSIDAAVAAQTELVDALSLPGEGKTITERKRNREARIQAAWEDAVDSLAAIRKAAREAL